MKVSFTASLFAAVFFLLGQAIPASARPIQEKEGRREREHSDNDAPAVNPFRPGPAAAHSIKCQVRPPQILVNLEPESNAHEGMAEDLTNASKGIVRFRASSSQLDMALSDYVDPAGPGLYEAVYANLFYSDKNQDLNVGVTLGTRLTYFGGVSANNQKFNIFLFETLTDKDGEPSGWDGLESTEMTFSDLPKSWRVEMRNPSDLNTKLEFLLRCHVQD